LESSPATANCWNAPYAVAGGYDGRGNAGDLSETSEEVNDSGLRFTPTDESSFACPSCGTKVKAVIL
jgi:hypothetical protein